MGLSFLWAPSCLEGSPIISCQFSLSVGHSGVCKLPVLTLSVCHGSHSLKCSSLSMRTPTPPLHVLPGPGPLQSPEHLFHGILGLVLPSTVHRGMAVICVKCKLFPCSHAWKPTDDSLVACNIMSPTQLLWGAVHWPLHCVPRSWISASSSVTPSCA